MNSSKKKKKLLIAILLAGILSLVIFSQINSLNRKIEENQKQIEEKNQALRSVKNQNNQIGDALMSLDGQMVQTVVAKENLFSRTKIKPEYLTIKSIKSTSLKGSVFSDPTVLSGKILLNDVPAGSPITSKDIDTSSFEIPVGMRAITIPMEYIQGLSSYINIGSKIDVVSAVKQESITSEIVLQNVKVIAFETASRGSESDSSSSVQSIITAVTLEIPAKAISRTVSAMANGKVQLISRNDRDNTVVVQAVRRINRASNSFVNMGGGRPVLPPPPNYLNPKNFGALPAPDKLGTGISGGGPKVEVIQANVKSEVTFGSQL